MKTQLNLISYRAILMIYSPSLKHFTGSVEIPDWKTTGEFGSMVWGWNLIKMEISGLPTN
jgi:hypothetical protein